MAYEIRESKRARNLRITVYPDGRVVITKPLCISTEKAHVFAARRLKWINQQVARFKKRGSMHPPLPKPRRGTKAYTEAIQSARAFVHARLPELNRAYGFTYGTISIRNQKTRWGSCSARGNLSFNYRILYLPPALQDYLLVHELAHLKEHNHSVHFWNLVAKTIPEYQKLRTQLRTGYAL